MKYAQTSKTDEYNHSYVQTYVHNRNYKSYI